MEDNPCFGIIGPADSAKKKTSKNSFKPLRDWVATSVLERAFESVPHGRGQEFWLTGTLSWHFTIIVTVIH